MKKLITLLLSLALLATLLAGCKEKGKPATEDPAVTLRYGVTTEPDSLDPFLAAGADTKGLFFNVFEGLFKVGTDGGLNPAIATDYTVNGDSTVWTFTIRTGVKFHNGAELTPEDVEFSLGKAAEAGYYSFDKIADVAIDGNVVTVSLSEPNPEFLTVLTSEVVPKDYADQASAPVGTGPYKLESYKPQESLTFVRNEEYWGAEPEIDTVVVQIQASQTALVTSLQSGNIDAATVTAASIDQLDASAYDIVTQNSNGPQIFVLNNTYEPLTDVRVRQALNYAVNRREIIDIVGSGYGVQSESPLFPGLSKYYNENLYDAYPTDLETARSLLAAAGYPNGFDLEIKIPSNYDVHVQTGEVIVSQLQKIGVNATIKTIDWNTWLDDVNKGANYQASVITISGRSVNPLVELKRYTSTSSSNFFHYTSAEFDDVYSRAGSELDAAKRVSLYKELQQIVSDDAVSVYLLDIAGLTALNKSFTGLLSYPIYGIIDFAALKTVG